MIRLKFGDEASNCSVKALNKTTNEEFELQVFFVAIGHKPNTDILRLSFLDETGYIINVVGTAKQI
jgi:thioredoxin reductase